MLTFENELQQEITEWELVLKRLKSHLDNCEPSGWSNYLEGIESQANTNLTHIKSRLAENRVMQGRCLPDVACGNCKQIEFWYMKIKIQNEWIDGVSGEYNFVKQYCEAITDHDWKIIKVTQYKGDKEEEIESKPSA